MELGAALKDKADALEREHRRFADKSGRFSIHAWSRLAAAHRIDAYLPRDSLKVAFERVLNTAPHHATPRQQMSATITHMQLGMVLALVAAEIAAKEWRVLFAASKRARFQYEEDDALKSRYVETPAESFKRLIDAMSVTTEAAIVSPPSLKRPQPRRLPPPFPVESAAAAAASDPSVAPPPRRRYRRLVAALSTSGESKARSRGGPPPLADAAPPAPAPSTPRRRPGRPAPALVLNRMAAKFGIVPAPPMRPQRTKEPFVSAVRGDNLVVDVEGGAPAARASPPRAPDAAAARLGAGIDERVTSSFSVRTAMRKGRGPSRRREAAASSSEAFAVQGNQQRMHRLRRAFSSQLRRSQPSGVAAALAATAQRGREGPRGPRNSHRHPLKKTLCVVPAVGSFVERSSGRG